MTLENTPVQSPVDAFLATLRAATAHLHTALEARPLSRALMQDSVTLQEYAAYLHRMRSVIRFCEQHLFPLVSPAITDLPHRRKLHLIEADLTQVAPQLVSTVAPYHPFTTAEIGFALGYMYVIEGSTLGGRVLLKQLRPKLGIDERHGGAFFAGYGNGTATNWKTFLQQFCAYITGHRCEGQAIAGARHAFTSIAHHFDTEAE